MGCSLLSDALKCDDARVFTDTRAGANAPAERIAEAIVIKLRKRVIVTWICM
jgi:hypothetical protein